MATFSLNVNGANHTVDVDSDTPLLWVLRDELKLVGTKYGCGIAQCGACTVHIDGTAIRACSFPVEAVEPGQKIISIEGVNSKISNALKDAWVEYDVPQCGYCQAGQIMNAAAFLQDNPKPSEEDIDAAMHGNICRCGTYLRIKKAIIKASKSL